MKEFLLVQYRDAAGNDIDDHVLLNGRPAGGTNKLLHVDFRGFCKLTLQGSRSDPPEINLALFGSTVLKPVTASFTQI